MLQILPCPHCGKQSLLPHDTSLEASLKCPHCSEQLILGEALLEQFSSWEVVEDPVALIELENSSAHLSQSIAVPIPQDGDVRQEGLQLADSLAAVPNTPVPKVSVRPYTHFEYERMRKKQKSAIWSIVPIVLGGLAAFPIALLILWHALGKDVGDMGPKVAEYAPWIVPKQFHANSKPSPNPANKKLLRQGESGLPQLDNIIPKPTLAPELSETNVGPSKADASSPELKSDKELSSSTEVEPNSPPPSPSNGQDPPDQHQNLFVTIRESNELLIQLEKVMDSASADRKKELLFSAYERLAKMSMDYSVIDNNNQVFRTIKEQMKPIARIVKLNSKIQVGLDNVAKIKASEKPSSDSIGIAMTLEITGAEQLQEYWMVSGNHQLDTNTVFIVPRTLSPALVEGQKLFVLGVLSPAISSDESATPVLRVSYLHSL